MVNYSIPTHTYVYVLNKLRVCAYFGNYYDLNMNECMLVPACGRVAVVSRRSDCGREAQSLWDNSQP